LRFIRLKLNGFKSFVDPTDLVIADGLTGVVGPNGCGKSNLLEALRWVMGENRPTAMRGDGMDDVIFAGAAGRPARHFAEVVLSLDNSERLAPAGFNDDDSLDIARRITREAGSAYRINGREVRARDVQMLFADAATGAQSPALVRQGQISELINARPRARRKVLEDAAGIGGLYQRRHEAELRLSATEANLARLEDLREALAAQIAALARQARQAARYREIGTALRRAEGLALYLHWRAADTADAAAAAEARTRLGAAATAEAGARAAARAREEAEAALPPLRDEAAVAAAVLQRLEVERAGLADTLAAAEAAIADLATRHAQMLRDRDREAALTTDAAEALARLGEEADALSRDDGTHAVRLAEAAEAARAAATALADDEARLAAETEAAARLAARHQAAERLAAEARATAARAATEAERAASGAEAASRRRAEAETALATAAGAEAEAQSHAEAAETALAEAETARSDAQQREADARAARAGAEGEHRALAAEAAALTRLVERAAGGGTEILARVGVAPGYEAALGAALGDDLGLPEATADAPEAGGWHALPPHPAAPPLPDGAAPLAPHVTAPPALARRLAQIGVVDDPARGTALMAALAPGQRLVSREGDLWRWDGLASPAGAAPAAAALHLQQVNRLASLRRDLVEAEARAAGTVSAHDHLRARLEAATAAEAEARRARRAADSALNETHRARTRAEADVSLAEGHRDASARAARRLSEAAAEAAEAAARADAALAEVPDPAGPQQALAGARGRLEAARQATLTARAHHDDLRRAAEARSARLSRIAAERETWAGRLATAEDRARDLATRLAETEAALAEARARPAALRERAGRLEQARADALARDTAASEALAAAETAQRRAAEAERAAERAAADARATAAAAAARAEAASAARAEALSRLRDETEAATPAELFATLGLDDGAPLPTAAESEAEAARLRRAREALGAVNLRAEEDARTVQAEHDTLVAERDDLEAAVRKLRAGIAALNREGRERLLTAFEQVNTGFARLFTHLFGGGEARLTLVDSDDPLEAGLDILCQPPGKKLSTLSLLSGGEQTLTALALIFAVFLTNPAPICVLDEVDAPLDDANVARFCDLLDEMTRQTETRFLIITHHAVTMARMDRLFGVTMAEQGVSQLVSVDLRAAEALVA